MLHCGFKNILFKELIKIMKAMDKKDLTEDDKKLWKWLTQNVASLGENSVPD
ncbi:hypothetical protein LCGC14_3038900, partial [marine sediment metagenome]